MPCDALKTWPLGAHFGVHFGAHFGVDAQSCIFGNINPVMLRFLTIEHRNEHC